MSGTWGAASCSCFLRGVCARVPVYACEHTCDMHFLPPQGVPDVRLAYIQFALSFLIAGDASTVTQVLELKGRRASLSWGLASP